MILLDTHAWLWWSSGSDRLTAQQTGSINAELAQGERLAVSAVSVWEIGLLASTGRIGLDASLDEWLRREMADPALLLVPLTWQRAAASTQLPGTFHRDPADRFLVATARDMGIPLVTADARIQAYLHVQTV